MDKLSGILPSNARVASVDMSESLPARPGAPLMGRKEGRNTINDRVTVSAHAKELAARDTMMMKNPKEAAKAKMVAEITRNFFENRIKPVEKEAPQSQEVADALVDAPHLESMAAEPVSAPEHQPAAQPRLSIEA